MRYFKSVGMFIAVVSLALLGNEAMARGGGQGEHEADSGGGSIYAGGGGGFGGGGAGQGQEGPGGSGGAAVSSGFDSNAVGQAQFGGGSGFYNGGGGGFYSAPAFESSPLVGPNTMIAGQPNGSNQVAIDPRYQNVNGTWFYLVTDNRWARFENGNWVDNNTGLALNATPANGSVAVDSPYRYTNDTWFYQLPDKHWVRFENGAWTNDNAGPIASRPTPSVERR